MLERKTEHFLLEAKSSFSVLIGQTPISFIVPHTRAVFGTTKKTVSENERKGLKGEEKVAPHLERARQRRATGAHPTHSNAAHLHTTPLASMSEMTEQSGIQVVVRLRPMSERELKGNTLPVVTASTEKKEVTVIKGTGARTLRNTFAFDNVFTVRTRSAARALGGAGSRPSSSRGSRGGRRYPCPNLGKWIGETK
jgi:hypothetical protein